MERLEREGLYTPSSEVDGWRGSCKMASSADNLPNRKRKKAFNRIPSPEFNRNLHVTPLRPRYDPLRSTRHVDRCRIEYRGYEETAYRSERVSVTAVETMFGAFGVTSRVGGRDESGSGEC